ncbi:DUF3108 domain-containing protein [Thiomicrospira pelophila]|uniref:DUF3108 domain-containing protein n=1 Tax=Thiomicrospira pelophila TaxID=934 RepID=UPI0004A77DB6|nr:DUF3108 domain-containing protein [Thiomicrospira pelophila]
MQTFRQTITLLAFVGLIITSQAQANPSQNFDAEFAVRLMGFNVGTVQQKMRCQTDTCTLTSEAEPPWWAKRFINESTYETTKILTKNNQFLWLSYHKDLTQRHDDYTKHIKVDLIANLENNIITFPQKDRSWPGSPYAYDIMSIAYALQFYTLNGNAIPPLVLQEEKQQTLVKFNVANQATKAHLNYKSNLKARYYEWTTDTQEIKIWLIEDLNFFPGRIEVNNTKHKRRVVLALDKPPHFP